MAVEMTENMIDQMLGREVDESAFFKVAEGNDEEMGLSIGLLYRTFLKEQIETEIIEATVETPPKDFLTQITERIDLIRIKAEQEEEDVNIDEIDGEYRALLVDVVEALEKRFDFDFSAGTEMTAEDMDLSDLESRVSGLYEFFVVKRIKNMVTFFQKFIFSNRKVLAREYRPRLENKKDFSLTSLKETFKNFDDVVVMYFLKDIMVDAVESGLPFSDLISLLETENEGEISLVVAKGAIDGEESDVVRNYLAPIVNDDEVLQAITAKVRMELIEDLPKKD